MSSVLRLLWTGKQGVLTRLYLFKGGKKKRNDGREGVESRGQKKTIKDSDSWLIYIVEARQAYFYKGYM